MLFFQIGLAIFDGCLLLISKLLFYVFKNFIPSYLYSIPHISRSAVPWTSTSFVVGSAYPQQWEPCLTAEWMTLDNELTFVLNLANKNLKTPNTSRCCVFGSVGHQSSLPSWDQLASPCVPGLAPGSQLGKLTFLGPKALSLITELRTLVFTATLCYCSALQNSVPYLCFSVFAFFLSLWDLLLSKVWQLYLLQFQLNFVLFQWRGLSVSTLSLCGK